MGRLHNHLSASLVQFQKKIFASHFNRNVRKAELSGLIFTYNFFFFGVAFCVFPAAHHNGQHVCYGHSWPGYPAQQTRHIASTASIAPPPDCATIATSAPGTHAHSTQLPPCSYPGLLEDLELLADVDKTGGSSPASCTNSSLQDLFDIIEDFPESSESTVSHQRDLEGEPQWVAVQ